MHIPDGDICMYAYVCMYVSYLMRECCSGKPKCSKNVHLSSSCHENEKRNMKRCQNIIHLPPFNCSAYVTVFPVSPCTTTEESWRGDSATCCLSPSGKLELWWQVGNLNSLQTWHKIKINAAANFCLPTCVTVFAVLTGTQLQPLVLTRHLA